MGIKNWMNKRREKKESQERFMTLTEEELENLRHSEKIAYLEIARKQVTYRGKINAYKDFPITEDDFKVISKQQEDKELNEAEAKNVNKIVRQM